MRAVRCVDGAVAVVEVREPDRDGIRVHVRSAGICGSDLHLLDAGFLGRYTIGHEFGGVTDDGTAVAVEPVQPCNACDQCATGEYQRCRRLRLFGIGADGGMADLVVVPERCLVPLAAGVDLANASLVEPMAVAVHGYRRVGWSPATRVAVVGAGSIGLCAAAVATTWGGEVALDARYDHQRAAGAALGATEPDGEYDVVVDAVGSEASMTRAAELCAPGATILFLAMAWDATIPLPGMVACMRELGVMPAIMYGHTHDERDIDAAAAVLGDNAAIPSAIVTHRFPLDGAPEAFATARNRSAGAIKVVLEP